MRRTVKSRRKAASVDVGRLVDDLAALRTDFAALVGQIKSGAVDHASQQAERLLSELSERANELYETATEQGTQSIEAVSEQVRARPIASLLLAFGLGFIASRMILR